MKQNIILRHDRLRRIPVSFTWLDHRLWRDGYLGSLGATELRLYMFLLLVGDRYGVSYWGDNSVCAQLQIRPEQLKAARARLMALSLVAYRRPHYQVLSLPDEGMADGDGAIREVGGIVNNMLSHSWGNRRSRRGK